MTGKPSPITPGEPPRTSTWSETYLPNVKTVHPVGPSAYSATPTSSPGKSMSSQRFASISVRGLGRTESFDGRGAGSVMRRPPSRGEGDAHRRVRRDTNCDRREDLGGGHRSGVRLIGGRPLAPPGRGAAERFGAYR